MFWATSILKGYSCQEIGLTPIKHWFSVEVACGLQLSLSSLVPPCGLASNNKYTGYELRFFLFLSLCCKFFRWFNDLKNPPVNVGGAGDPVWIPGKIPWWRKWQPTPVSLLGEFHGRTSLAGYSLWTHKRALHGWARKHACYIKGRLCTVAKLRCEAIFLFSQRSNYFTRRYLP